MILEAYSGGVRERLGVGNCLWLSVKDVMAGGGMIVAEAKHVR